MSTGIVMALATILTSQAAGTSGAAELITHDQFARMIEKPTDLRILDVRPKADFQKGHIPGAVWVDVKAAEGIASRPGGLKDRDAWSAWIAPLHLVGQKVVIYGDNRQLDAARVWWLLSYLGVERAALLDGNYRLWATAGRPTKGETLTIVPEPFPIRFREDRIASRKDVSDLLKKPGTMRVVDARTTGEHEGTEKRSKRAGRIPSACRLEWSDLVDKDGRFLDEKALRAKIAETGIEPGTPVVTHCQGGGRASVDAFVFERLGHPTRNYYLGWSDWGNAEETPVETGKNANR